jgi:transcriptional regulator GlxA family with amidase domain
MFDFTVIVLEGAYGTAVAATLDILQAAAGLAARASAPAPTWRVCSVSGGPVRLQSGMVIDTQKLAAKSRLDTSTWIIPGLALNTEADIKACAVRADVMAVANILPSHLQRGGKIAACCSAVFVLQFAGVLDGRRVTTTWWLAPLLRRMNPTCKVDADHMVCADGPIATGGAAFAQTDLMLHLLRDKCGSKLTAAISRFLLIDARQAQANYIVPEVMAGGDALISRLIARVENMLPDVPSVAELARVFCVSERTLSRHVHRSIGKSTIALVQSVKIRKARALLEQSRMSVEQVAAAVGYSDPTALRRLMKKMAGASPSQYRPGASAPGASRA